MKIERNDEKEKELFRRSGQGNRTFVPEGRKGVLVRERESAGESGNGNRNLGGRLLKSS